MHAASCFAFLTLMLGVASACAHRRPETVPIREGFVTADDGAKLYYTIMGSGPDTVLAPAAAYLAADFATLTVGRVIVTYDPRSRGKSEMLTDSSRFGFYKDVEDMEAVRRTLKISRMSLLGWSYLGGVVAVYASRHPERVSRIVQIGPIAPRSGGGWNDTRQITRQLDTAAIRGIREMRSNLRTGADSLLYCRLDVRHRMLPGAMADTAAIARMKADPCTSQNETPERWRRSVALAMAQLGNDYDLRSRLGVVSVPVLVVWGDADAVPEASVREWVRSWPDSRLVIIRRAGHLPWLEHPEVFFPAVDSFLRGKWPASAEPPANSQDYEAVRRSNSFIVQALGGSVVAFLVIMLW